MQKAKKRYTVSWLELHSIDCYAADCNQAESAVRGALPKINRDNTRRQTADFTATTSDWYTRFGVKPIARTI